jgi:hypothetical protein
MPPVSMKYYSDHVPMTVFNNQSALSAILGGLGNRQLIESSEVSPLTIRLFQAKYGLEQIVNCVSRLAVKTFPQIFVENRLYVGPESQSNLLGVAAPSGSMEYTHTFDTPRAAWQCNDPLSILPNQDSALLFTISQPSPEIIRISEELEKVHTFELHTGVYSFFTNLDSIFDRLRLELNSIYFDGVKLLRGTRGAAYWYEYVSPTNPTIQALAANGYNAMVNILTGGLASSVEARTGKYRNRLVHDGDLEMRIGVTDGKVFIPDDPLAVPVTFGTELKPLVSDVFSDVQTLLRNIYQQIIVDLNARNVVPLI